MEVTPELLEKYYRGLCTTAEQQAVEAWQESSEADDEVILPIGEDKQTHKNQIWASLASILDESKREEEDTAYISKKQKPSKKGHLFWRIAACLAIASCAALYFAQLNCKKSTEPVAAIVYKTIRAQRGQKLAITLIDGTVVRLNSESELKYPERFTDTSRIIYLSGEAHFKVAKDKSRPFSIYTASTLTRVLGTVFDLKAYPNEPVLLAVEEGRVRFGGIPDSRHHNIYTANQASSYTPNGQLNNLQGDIHAYSSWTKNQMVFTGQTLDQIIPVLERWYNVSIHIENKNLYHETFTGDFQNPSLDFLLDRIGFVMKFHHSVNNSTVIIK